MIIRIKKSEFVRNGRYALVEAECLIDNTAYTYNGITGRLHNVSQMVFEAKV